MLAQGHNLRPQVAAAQPLVTQDVHRCAGRDRGGQLAQQGAEVDDPGALGLGRHHMSGHRDRVLAADHADDQGPPRVPVVRRVNGQGQGRRLCLEFKKRIYYS